MIAILLRKVGEKMGNRSKQISNSISSRIRYLRQKNNLTQKELGNKLFKSESAIRMWELGKSEPDLQTVKQLAIIFNTSSEFILTGEKTAFTFDDLSECDKKLLKSLNELPDNEKELIIDLIESRIKKAGL